MKTRLAILLATSCVFSSLVVAQQAPSDSEFASPTIDLGCVVSDIDASVKFYTEAIGFQAAGGFQVDAEFATDVGLTDGKMLDIKILTLDTGEGATKLKLMQVKGGSKKADHSHINTTLGFSYITVAVKSSDKALARLKKAGVKPIAKGPLALPKNLNPAIALTIVRDPDGNFVELVGPRPTK